MEDPDKAVDADGEEDADEKPRNAKSKRKTKKTKKNVKVAESTDDLEDEVAEARAPAGSAGGDDASTPSTFGRQKDSMGAEAAKKSALSMLMNSAVTEEQKRAQVLEMEKLMKDIDLLNFGHDGRKHYQFWDTQPVPKIGEQVEDVGPIEPDVPVVEIRKESYSLPAGFVWDTLDIDDEAQLKELYQLLNENYVEDDDNMFRFDYSPEFLRWALQPPGWMKEWHCGVRVAKNRKLVGFISGVPANIRVYQKEVKMAEINFLCVHKKLRSRRVAPVLIKEITRRVNLQGIFQAVYTAGVVIPKPISVCRYWHRSLNPKKLIDVRFSHLGRNMTLQRTIKLYRLPDETKTPGFRPMTTKDVEPTRKLLMSYLRKFDLSPMYNEAEFRHWFMPRENIINSYVVENEKGVITDFVSFYTLPSTVMHHPTYNSLKAAYSFYNVSSVTSWTDLMQDALIIAKKIGFDVFNALDLMDNNQFLDQLKFGIGDGNLHYYLFNFRCPVMEPQKIGLVLQ